MIVVKVEYWPEGSSDLKELIAEARISNVSNGAVVSDYNCSVVAQGLPELYILPVNKTFRVRNHPRSAGVVELVARVFNIGGSQVRHI